MKIIPLLLSLCASCFGQGAVCMGVRQPSTIVQYSVFTSNDIYALSPIEWFAADVGVAVTAGRVDTWSDLSANAYTLTQSGNKPYYRLSSLNGLPGIDFGPASVTPLTNALPVSYPQPTVLFVVMIFSNGVAGADYLFCNGSGGSTLPPSVTINQDSGGPRIQAYSNMENPRRSVSNTVYMVTAVFASNSPPNIFSTLYQQHKKVWTSTSIGAETNLFKQTAIGGIWSLSATVRFYGTVYEFILCSGPLSESNRIGVEMYLRKKYALSFPF